MFDLQGPLYQISPCSASSHFFAAKDHFDSISNNHQSIEEINRILLRSTELGLILCLF